ncbi:hypothetical protein [Streptomyces reniochalinae]|uniref:Uncharacterized protein n=1 Tax=Streptomyces reniochalinae TaxID=2250578 RepID=A0A367ELB6_9ACTN|nr:hypothetical protein [Streptomyces reniochalinae]RCG18187.1 hypothetical protein DQ392_15030 [Streptomyces reniochalinae]
MPRRRLLVGASAAALAVAGCGVGEDGEGDHEGDGAPDRPATAPSGILGVNFNEDPTEVNSERLRGASASWVRGFVPTLQVDRGPAEKQRAVAALLEAHEHHYGTVLSLKFPYQQRPLPAPGSGAMDTELARVDKVARAVLGKVDILAIGNEPFLESRRADREGPALNRFYEHVAEHLIAYREKHFPQGCRTRLYMGALNHLDNPAERTPATRRWLEFVHDTRELEGVDIHPHVTSLDAAQQYLDYVLPHLRSDQKFLATEFSLVLTWRAHMRDRIPPRFARRYGVAPDTRVWQLLRKAADSPFPQDKWNAFLSMSPWFHGNRHYLRDQVRRFRDTGKLAVATYGVAQGAAMVRDIGPDKHPWMLNSLYATRTVRQGPDGSTGRTHPWFEDFTSLQRKTDRLPVRTGTTAT